MKVLHVAVFTAMSTNVWQADGFENLGCDVIRYDYRQRLKDLGSVTKRDDDLIELCNKEKPDIILYSKCNNMDVRVVTECGKIGTTVLWYMDNKWNLDDEVRQKFIACDHVFCSRWDGYDVAVTLNNSVHKLQGGYNPKVHYPIDTPKIRDVAFIGQLRNDRAAYKQHRDFDVINGMYNEDHSRTVSETKINLSFTEGDGVSNRLYKLMAAGGFVLTSPWYKMEKDFDIGKDFDVFRSPAEFKEKIDYYLAHEDEREFIAEQGFRTVQRYDNNNYAIKIMGAVQNADTKRTI